MKLTTTRLVRILICLAIVLAVVPVMAFAADKSDVPQVLSEGDIILTDTAVITDENLYEGVEYTWFATGNGTLTIKLSDFEFGWWYTIDCGNGAESYNNKYDTVPASYNVTKGTQVVITVGAYDPEYYLKLYGADLGGDNVTGSVSVELSFVESGVGGGEIVTPSNPGDSESNPKVITSSAWLNIEAGQTIWFCYDNTDNMMNNGVYSQMLNINSAAGYSVSYRGQDVPVDADGYVNYEMMDISMMGKYIFSVTNNSSAKQFFAISVSNKPEYVNTYMSVELGDTTVSIDPSATYTLYEFQPSETGVYLISIPDTAGVIGDWGTTFFPQDKTEDKTNTLSWTCTSVGQSVVIGIKSFDEEVVLSIERTGDYVPAPVIEWTMVENEELELVKDMVFAYEEMTEINVIDGIEDIIYDVGGLFRYGSPSGPLVVSIIDDAEWISLREAYGYGQLRFSERDGDGQVIAKYDCNEALLEYMEAGIVPLTYELIWMLDSLGVESGWYDSSIPGFYLFDGDEVDPSTAFLAFCGYIEGTELVPDEFGTEVESDFESDGNTSETVVLYPAADGVVSVQIKDCTPGFSFIVYENGQLPYDYFEGNESGIYSFEVTGGNVYDIYICPAEYVEEFDCFLDAAGSVSYKVTYAETAVEEDPVVPPVTEPSDPSEEPTDPSEPSVEPSEPSDEPSEPSNPSEEPTPGTGDMGLAAVIVTLMAATTGVVVLTKKKES